MNNLFIPDNKPSTRSQIKNQKVKNKMYRIVATDI